MYKVTYAMVPHLSLPAERHPRSAGQMWEDDVVVRSLVLSIRGLPLSTSALRGGGSKIGQFCGLTVLEMQSKGEGGSKIPKIVRTRTYLMEAPKFRTRSGSRKQMRNKSYNHLTEPGSGFWRHSLTLAISLNRTNVR